MNYRKVQGFFIALAVLIIGIGGIVEVAWDVANTIDILEITVMFACISYMLSAACGLKADLQDLDKRLKRKLERLFEVLAIVIVVFGLAVAFVTLGSEDFKLLDVVEATVAIASFSYLLSIHFGMMAILKETTQEISLIRKQLGIDEEQSSEELE